MQTRDHKMLAEYLTDQDMWEEMPVICKWAFIFGNIEPDRNLFTYLRGFRKEKKLRGHNYKNIIPIIRRELLWMEKQEDFDAYVCYRFGKLMHYMADAFTFPHNELFRGNIKAHCRYEARLHDEIQRVLEERTEPDVMRLPVRSMWVIETLHAHYLAEQEGCDPEMPGCPPEEDPVRIQTDCGYIVQICEAVCAACMAHARVSREEPVYCMGGDYYLD